MISVGTLVRILKPAHGTPPFRYGTQNQIGKVTKIRDNESYPYEVAIILSDGKEIRDQFRKDELEVLFET